MLNKAKSGLTAADAKDIFSSPQLNDRPKLPGASTDAYANISEGNVFRPIHAEPKDMRIKVSINGREIKFTTAKARDAFVSEAGRFYATKAAPTYNPLPAEQKA